MKKRLYIPTLVLVLLLSGCGGAAPWASVNPQIKAEAQRLAAVQLGRLDGQVTYTERQQVVGLLEQLVALRQTREELGVWKVSGGEERLTARLNQLYEDCTRRYLGDLGSWSADEEKIELLAEYDVKQDGALEPGEGEDVYRPLWEQVKAMLPEGSLEAFTRFTVFTDGEEEILAYVVPVDDDGAQWELAVDPKDAVDENSFAETVFHEYCHYLTLNDEQVVYGGTPSQNRYAESELVARAGSYLDAFYQRFWRDYLDDRLADPESYGFYLRHADDFLTGYAATNPSEDIAESFAYFILYDRAEGDGTQAQKQNFFYDYPKMVEFREQARERLGL